MIGLDPYQPCLSGILSQDFHGAGSNAGPIFLFMGRVNTRP